MEVPCAVITLFVIFAHLHKEIYSEELAECKNITNHSNTADMKLNETAITAEYVAEMKNFPHWKDVITKAIKMCIANDFTKPNAKCKSGSNQFSVCLEKYIFLHCPEDGWQGTGDELCESTKRVLEKCMASASK